MRAKTQTLNEQIRLLMNDFTGQAVSMASWARSRCAMLPPRRCCAA